ncbi:G-protein coupled receptor [Branchiostoma belcheri]|nr:G-protein coupled receptor [Branchiostoma belcheri]
MLTGDILVISDDSRAEPTGRRPCPPRSDSWSSCRRQARLNPAFLGNYTADDKITPHDIHLGTRPAIMACENPAPPTVNKNKTMHASTTEQTPASYRPHAAMSCLIPPLLYRPTAADLEAVLLQSVASDRFQGKVHPYCPHRYTLEEVKIKDVALRLVAVHQMEMREAHLVLTGQRIWPAAKRMTSAIRLHSVLRNTWRSWADLDGPRRNIEPQPWASHPLFRKHDVRLRERTGIPGYKNGMVGGVCAGARGGPGLPGLVAAKLAPQPDRVVLTDNKDLVLDLLEKNILKNFNDDDPMADKPQCGHLEWGKGVTDFRDQHGGFDVILASDVIYHRPDIPLLLQTARDLLNDKPSSVLLLSYNDRAKIFQQTVKETAQECGLEWTDIPFRELLPDFSQHVHPDEVRHLHLMVFMKGAS